MTDEERLLSKMPQEELPMTGTRAFRKICRDCGKPLEITRAERIFPLNRITWHCQALPGLPKARKRSGRKEK